MAFREYLAGEVAQDFADGHLSRREALRRLGMLGVGLAGAGSLLAACGGDDDDQAPAVTSTTTASATGDDGSGATPSIAPIEAEQVIFAGPNGELQGAYAAPAGPRAAVLVIHENRGLTPHFFDVVARLAADGYAALCVDLLSAEGGTASLDDEAQAPAMLAGAPLERLLGDLRAGVDELERAAPGVSAGAVGFCFGGAMVWSLLDAGEERIAAAVPFYGPGPAEPDFSGAQAAVLGIYAELDARVNASRESVETALQDAGLTYEIKTYPGVDHAFFNDTGPRYDEAAATEAYADMLEWFSEHLA